MKMIGVIPARLASTRLDQKVLRPIAGKPMILWVAEQAKKAKSLDDVIVACDDEKVLKIVQEAGGYVKMTSKDHPNGTSRVAEIAESLEADVYINIQGDEPFIHPENIDLLASSFEDDSVEVATLGVSKNDKEGYLDPNLVKVVLGQNQNALYFSRAPIPHHRDQGPLGYVKHLGIYGYRRNFLLDYVKWDTTALENIEKLEQLKILENGHKIKVLLTEHDSVGVDTEADLSAVEKEYSESKKS